MKFFGPKKLFFLLASVPLVATSLVANSCSPQNYIVYNFATQQVVNKIQTDFTSQTLSFENYIQSAAFNKIQTESLSLLFSSTSDKNNPTAALSKLIDTATDKTNPQFFYASGNWTTANIKIFKAAISKNIAAFLSMVVMTGLFYQYDRDDTKKALSNLDYIDKTSKVYIYFNYLKTQNLINADFMQYWLINVKNLVDKGYNSITFIENILTVALTDPTFNMPFVTNKQFSPDATNPNFNYVYMVNLASTSYKFTMQNYQLGTNKYYLDNVISGTNQNSTDFKFDDYLTNASSNLYNAFNDYLSNSAPGSNFNTFLTSQKGGSILTTYVHQLAPQTKNLTTDISHATAASGFFTSKWNANQKHTFENKLAFNIINNVFGSTIVMAMLYTKYKDQTSQLLDNPDIPKTNLVAPWDAYQQYLSQNSVFSLTTLLNLKSNAKDCFDHGLDASVNQTTSLCYAMFTYDWHTSFALTLPKVTFNPSSGGANYNFSISLNGKTLTFSTRTTYTTNINLAQISWNKLY